jgi:hypothetical protein
MHVKEISRFHTTALTCYTNHWIQRWTRRTRTRNADTADTRDLRTNPSRILHWVADFAQPVTEHLLLLCVQSNSSFRGEHRDIKVKKTLRYLCTRSWRPIRLKDVEDRTLSRKTDHRWRWGYQCYAPATLCPQKHFLSLTSARGCVNSRDIMRLERLGKLKIIQWP